MSTRDPIAGDPTLEVRSVRITTRCATPPDAPSIARIHAASWEAGYRGLLHDDHLARVSVADRQTSWQAAIARGEPAVWVAELDDAPVGFVAFGRDRDAAADAGPAAGEIWALYVDPPSWSLGAGRALQRAAIDALRAVGANRVAVWVLAGNARAIRSYERAGFTLDPEARKPVRFGGVEYGQSRYVMPLVVDERPLRDGVSIA